MRTRPWIFTNSVLQTLTPGSFGPMQQDTAKEEEEKQCENEYETARREALERMRAEEERRQLEGKLQAEALRQQMEELKVKEMEVRVSPTARASPAAAACYKWALRKLL